MDIGDIIQWIFWGFIFLSIFGGFFGRKDKQDSENKRRTRPTELSQSGGADRERPQQRPQQAQAQRAASHEEQWEQGTLAHPEQHTEETRERYGTSTTFTYDDAIESGETRTDARREELRERFGHKLDQGDIRSTERGMREQDLTDMPRAENLYPERRRASTQITPMTSKRTTRRRQKRDGGDVLRQWLRDPDTLGRAFIIKEVLDPPVGVRDDR